MALADINKKILIPLVFVVLVLIGVAMWTWTYYQAVGSNTADTNDASATSAQKEEKSLKAKLDTASSSKDKAKAYSDLSNFYANQPEAGDESVSYAKKAVEQEPTADTYAQLAFAAEQAGDVEQAIEAYEKAASMSEKTALDDGRSDYSYYMMQARLLRESQE
ncbi:TPA: hypothetical protein DIV49_03500 [Candidatus Saccharibacteria bacterium]|nr:hypothetical protein [Candidatus Saccharibacteria bacterium]HRJ90631.1 hypothetical protein [Candidatus Saccharibacteria bacterium]